MLNRESNAIFEEIVQVYSEHANTKIAAGMKAYMKNLFAYHGIQKPLRKEISTNLIKRAATLPFSDLDGLIRQLWELPERENQYIAMEILEKSKFWKREPAIDLIEYLLTTKSWWDTVDAIASKFVGSWFLAFPNQRNKYIDLWMNSKNIWLQRTCIIFQLKYQTKTDIDLLKACIEPLLDSKEFFIQKAIGWSLRQLAKTQPKEVLNIVEAYPLKPLSKREALKHLKPNAM